MYPAAQLTGIAILHLAYDVAGERADMNGGDSWAANKPGALQTGG